MRGALWNEARLQLKIFFRSPIAAFFTLAFPLMVLLLLSALNSSATIDSMGGISAAQFFTPGIAVFGMVTATFTNLAILTAMARDNGVLKRLLATPATLRTHVAGRILAAVIVGIISVVLMLAVGMLFFDVEVPTGRIPTVALIMGVGAATFSALGLAVAGLSPNARTAPALANATILPMAFVSGIFFPLAGSPTWLQTMARVLPLEPMASSVIDQFNPTATPEFPWPEIGLLLVWLVIGVVASARLLTWEPKGPRRRSES